MIDWNDVETAELMRAALRPDPEVLDEIDERLGLPSRGAPSRGEDDVTTAVDRSRCASLDEIARLAHPRHVLVRTFTPAGETASGILIAHDERIPLIYAVVVMPGVWGSTLEGLRPGDVVRFRRYADEPVELREGQHQAVSVRDLEAVFEGASHVVSAADADAVAGTVRQGPRRSLTETDRE